MINFKYAPIKNHILDFNKGLFYKCPKQMNYFCGYTQYNAFDKSGKLIGHFNGKMDTVFPFSESRFFPYKKAVDSFYLNYIESHKHNFLNEMLTFISFLSKRNGGKGRFHLIAIRNFTPSGKIPPHVKYRAYGMKSLDEKKLFKIDEFLKGNIPLEKLRLGTMKMYYVPKNKRPV